MRWSAPSSARRERVGLQLEAGLPEAIIADVSDQPGALPLLQYALTELFEQSSAIITLTKAAYHNLGGVKGALGRRAEEVYQSLDESQQARRTPNLPAARHAGRRRRRYAAAGVAV